MITGNRVIIRDKRLADAWEDYTWETDPELAHLDATPVVTATFYWYLMDYVNELDFFYTTSHRFAVDTLDGKHIGNCSFYNINETRSESEVGIMIGNRDYWNKGYGVDILTALVNHIFCETELNRIYLKTLESNARARKCFLKCGFVPYKQENKDGFSFVQMELYREQWLKQPAKTQDQNWSLHRS